MNLKERIEELNNILQNTPNISVSIPRELEQFIDYFNCPEKALEIIEKQQDIIKIAKSDLKEIAYGQSVFEPGALRSILASELLDKIKEMEEND